MFDLLIPVRIPARVRSPAHAMYARSHDRSTDEGSAYGGRPWRRLSVFAARFSGEEAAMRFAVDISPAGRWGAPYC